MGSLLESRSVVIGPSRKTRPANDTPCAFMYSALGDCPILQFGSYFWERPASGSQASLNFYRVDDETALFAFHDAFRNQFLEALAHFRPRGLHQVRDVLTA